jgi:Y-X(10)_GDL-associated radical SAM protein
MTESVRTLADADIADCTPVHVVWEITLACDLKCQHCGSRAGRRRPKELTTAECLAVIAGLAELGTREVNLIGGEAYLRSDWLELIAAIRGHGMACFIQSGGRNFTQARLDAAIAAGLMGLGVSIDGVRATHDRIRGVAGSHDAALGALRRARAGGIVTSVNTQIGALSWRELPAIMDAILAVGVRSWQLQLTVAMGNAVDNDELLLQPHQLAEVMPLLADLHARAAARGLDLQAGNNIGFFGPYEQLWRGPDRGRHHWIGCRAGQNVIALEADGSVKGCPSLPTARYTGGNVRDAALRDIWAHAPEIDVIRGRHVDDLWGYCRRCYYAEACMAGCTWTADALLGRPGNNPYCHHRVIELAKEGLRERIVKREAAPAEPFAIGGFAVITEPIPGSAQSVTTTTAEPAPALVTLRRPRKPPSPATAAPRRGVDPPTLELCRGCGYFVWQRDAACPFCGGDVAATAATHAASIAAAHAAAASIREILDRVRNPLPTPEA